MHCGLSHRQRTLKFGMCLIAGVLLSHQVMATPARVTSPTLSGTTGLNTIPSARMPKSGEITIGTGTTDPFIHSFASLQIASPLEITLRQSARISSLRQDADNLSPGADMKLRVYQEERFMPEIAIGMQGALGDKEMRAPYVTLSKRWHDFDFTLGKGWGRYDRDFGIFAGAEYFLPVKGLSAKLDYDPQSYDSEKVTGYNPPPRWSLGLNYAHKSGLSASIGTQGAQKIFGRISYQFNPQLWKLDKDAALEKPFYKQRPPVATLQKIIPDGAQEGIYVTYADFKDNQAFAQIALTPNQSTTAQIGRTARIIAQNGGETIESITITPEHMGLHGKSITLQRAALERAHNQNSASPQEIWRSTSFGDIAHPTHGWNTPQIPRPELPIYITLEQSLDLGARHDGVFHRTALLVQDVRRIKNTGFISASGLRLNLTDNLDAHYGAPLSGGQPPVRSDIELFAKRHIALDTAILAYTHSFGADFHVMGSAGYLDENFVGLGVQGLYRPPQSRLALGAQFWRAYKRNPYTVMNMDINDTHSHHVALLEGWYDFHKYDVTLHAQAGRFLGGDNGVNLALEKNFKNGVILSGSLAVSNKKQYDALGGQTQAAPRLGLKIPLGGLKYIPAGSGTNIKVEGMGDDLAQNINAPFNLYGLTTPLGIKHIADHWDEIIQ